MTIAENALIMISLVMLAGCVTDDYATGPIRMSEGTLAGYAKYKNLMSPGYFAVAVNGHGYGYTYCASGGSCSGNGIGTALDLCRAHAKTDKCVIYAYGGKPLFGGDEMPPVAVDRPKAQSATPALPAAPPTVTVPVNVQRNAESRLRELQRLRDQDLITQQEFDEKRRAILGSL